MFVTECKADFLGHQIVAHTSWGLTPSLKGFSVETKLYIDGKVVDTCGDSFALGNAPIMRGSITDEEDKVHVVEVYARSGWVRAKLRIDIDGKKVGGEDF